MVFQYYEEIFVASYKSTTITIDNRTYTFRRLKPDILMNNKGINIKENYSIASSERAFLDVLYLKRKILLR